MATTDSMDDTPFFHALAVFACLSALSCLSVVSGAIPGGPSAAPAPSPQALADLRREVDPLITSTDDVALRHRSADVFRLVDALLAHGDENEAARYLGRVLRADPWAFDYQLTYGEILARNGQPEALHSRALQAMQLAEDDGTIRRACRLAGVALPPPPPSLAKTGDDAPEIVLLQLGSVSQFWLADLRDALFVRLGVHVTIARAPLAIGPADRTGLAQFAAMMRKRLLGALERDQALAAFLAGQGIERQDVESRDDTVIRALRAVIANSDDPKALEDLNTRLRTAEQSGQQWTADKLLARIDDTVTPFKRPRRWFLAVTDCDLYSTGNNFLFGTAYNSNSTGVISAARFSAKFNDETPKRTRLTTRLIKQALSSYGFMLGVGRCSNPDCARAYPQSLEEHDAKSDQLCAECRAGFERALGRSLPKGF